MPRTWPLVGRDEELCVAARALGPRGDRVGIVLSGPAGVGKTRLAREVVARAGNGRAVHWVLATESSRELPLAAFGGVLGAMGPPTHENLDRAARVLAPGGERSAVIGIDDAHLLDDASAVLVHHLATRQRAAVVLTLRDGEPAPDAITALWKDEHVPRMNVAPLSEGATLTLLEQVLSGPLETEAAQRLWSLTRGNVLFLRHLVAGEVEAGRLHRSDGVWRWPHPPAITGELAEIVRRQMGDLPSAVRDTVDVLALAEPLSLDAVRSLTDAAALEEAESRGLVHIADEGGRLGARLAHPMYGEVRRTELGELRSRRLRGLIASTLIATGEADNEPVRRAVLVLDSNLPPDAALFLESAQHALAHLDLTLGERLARAAAEVSGDFVSRLALAFAVSYVPRPHEAESLLAELSRDAPDSDQRAIVTITRVGNLFWTLRQPDRARSVLNDELAQAPAGPSRAALLGQRVAMDASLGHTTAALRSGTTLLDEGSLTDVAAVMTSIGVVMAAAVQGRLSTTVRVAQAAHDVAVGDPTAIGPHFGLAHWGVLSLRLAGHVDRAVRLAAEVVHDVAEVPGPVQGMSRLVNGHAALAAGRIRTAERELREARASFGRWHPFTEPALLLLVQATALSGNPTEARRLLTALVALEDIVHPLIRPERLLAEAWVQAAEGATTRAVATARSAITAAREMDAPAYEVLALQTAVQFGDPSGADRLEELTGLVEGSRAPVALAHARAVAGRNGDALAAASERWEELGDRVAAADAAAQAAVHFRDDNRSGSALAAASRAHQLAAGPCDGLVTPALRAAERPLPLTDREREIVTLAARGLSNKEIAERLSVSVRTVEGHLYRASQKLGVHERSELAELLAIE